MDLNQQQIPQPAGTDENGNPYWIIEGRQYGWADMQQYLWQQQQLQPQQAVARSGGMESMPQMPLAQRSPEVAPNIPRTPEVGPETSFETGVEQAVETAQEHAGEQRQEQEQLQVQPPKPSTPSVSYVGDSQALEKVDTSSPTSMANYINQHKNDPKSSSGKFLSVFFEKLLKILSLSQ